ncbi:hypothetical protein RhiJN_13840 [Ceratobasidium sp. AG-Ba]|nr:hypothetical protein RhiJN_02650 [Ceratobasidium sp. AG-Ba]QRV85822.1 hypothetical protein RhiJN_13840 [Ceratobasidium sp. AG-Ba]QRW10493.1 hypothetical protein RhiLY_09492 [Ceratobasidium sp. AG-Ba]QRW13281.1 hypothetical protein RhiLY_12280 [Ceratobasidium sp. AG-Ba]QRW14399.1 hypothetical protein RhiLY_13398 [Ceratobasidium sp. AG-Ba]
MASPSENFTTSSRAKLVPYTRPSSEFRISAARMTAINAGDVPTNQASGSPPRHRDLRVQVQLRPCDCAPKDSGLIYVLKRFYIRIILFMILHWFITHPKSFETVLRLLSAISIILAHAGKMILEVGIECFSELRRLPSE